MRHKYHTRGIVLARRAAGETGAELTILTAELGLVRARAAGVRRTGARLAPALVTLAESDLVLVAGREGLWRVAGAVLAESWHRLLPGPAALGAAGRVTGLLIRLAPPAEPSRVPFAIFSGFLAALAEGGPAGAAECIAALHLLAAFGLGTTEGLALAEPFSHARLAEAARSRAALVARINNGLAHSGL